MLNRIYIVVGVLAILALASAFIVPRLIQWGDYRERMELIASQVLGTEVQILGDIEFTLLPAPQLKFANVQVGPAGAAVLSVDAIEAEFSLLDFLRDRYTFTRLVLKQPVLDVTIDESGLFQTPLNLAAEVSATNVAINSATIVDGTVRLFDHRSAESFAATALDGEVRLTALRGPFQFQGATTFAGQRYDFRFNASAMDADGATRLAVFVQPESRAFALSSEGVLATGVAPHYQGKLTYRQTAPVPLDAKTVQGDLLLESDVEAWADRVLLSAYTMLPDENRPGTRLTGAADLTLGATRDFDALVSGGVFALPPRDATEAADVEPYELVRMLAELPEPAIPALAGTLSIDFAEFNLRGLSLREVRIDALTDGRTWTIKQFQARLPGDTALEASGQLGVTDGRPSFTGETTITTERLDALALLWREAGEDNPLFNVPAALAAKVALNGDTLTFADGSFVLDGTPHAVAATVDFGPEPHLAVSAELGMLTADDSARLGALVPDPAQDAAFGVTFPSGSFAVSAQGAVVLGLDGVGLAAEGGWTGNIWQFDRLVAIDIGGVGLDLTATLGGTLADPRIAGNGAITIGSAAAPGLGLLFDTLETPPGWRAFLSRSLPADMAVELSLPNEQGGQVLAASGRLGAAEVGLDAQLGAGVSRALTGPLALTANFSSDDAAALAAQFGLADVSLFPNTGPVKVNAVFEGTGAEAIRVGITADAGGDAMVFDGSIDIDTAQGLSGEGTARLALSDASGLADIFGAAGVYLPPLSGSAAVRFSGADAISLSGIDGEAGGLRFTGDMAFKREGGASAVSGALTLAAFDAGALAAVLAGPAALIYGADPYWPDGPIAVGETARATRGNLKIAASGITVGGKPALSDASFDLVWDETNLRVRGLKGRFGGGTISLDIGVCCAGPLAEKQLSGRATLLGIDLDALLPPLPAATLGGMLQVAARFDSTGDSIAALVAGLAGEGSFALDGLTIEGFDPKVFPIVARLDNILELDAEAIEGIVRLGLEQGPFATPELSGAFTIAAGSVRATSIAADGLGGRLFGGAELQLKDLGLGGSFSLTPLGFTDPNGLITENTARVTAILSGSLQGPELEYDLGTMVDAIKVRAYELEVERLEILRAEDEARQLAAAQERERLMAEQARLLAEEEARQAAEAEAARKAADAAEAAARKAAEEATREAAEAALIAEAERLAAAEATARRAREAALAAEAERLAAEQEATRKAAEAAMIAEAERLAAEDAAKRRAAEEEAQRLHLLQEQQNVLRNDTLGPAGDTPPLFPEGSFDLVPPRNVGESFTILD